MRALSILANIAWYTLMVLFALFFTGVGVLFITYYFHDFSVDYALSNYRPWFMVLGIIMVGDLIVFLVSMWIRTRREDCIAFDNPEGEVVIAVRAVEDSVRRLVESFEEVRSASPLVVAANDGVDVEVRLVLWDDSSVHSSSERVQGAAKSHLQSYFGLGNINSVKVFISGTSSRGSASQRSEETDQETGDGQPTPYAE